MPQVVPVIAAAVATKVGTFIATMALSMALGAYQQSRTRKKQREAEQAAKDAYNASLKDRTVTVRSGISTRKYVLGRVRVGGTLMHIEANGWENTALDSVLAPACNKCELDGYYLGDEFVPVAQFPGEQYGHRQQVEHRVSRAVIAPQSVVTIDLGVEPIDGSVNVVGWMLDVTGWSISGSVVTASVDANAGGVGAGQVSATFKTWGSEKIRMIYKDGDPNQAAEGWPDIDTPMWTSEHRLRGVAYLRMLNLWDEDVYHSGAPQVGAVLKGGWVDGHPYFDPRTGTNPTHTTNPAILSAWYMTLPRRLGGMGIPESWVDWPYVSAAANICDEMIRVRTLDGAGYEHIKRYECNTVIDTGNPPTQNLDMILSAMAGDRVFTAGRYRIFAGSFRTATVTLTDDDVAGDKDIAMDKSGQDDAPANIVTSTFVNAHRNWLESSPRPIRNDTYVLSDGAESPLDLSLPATTDERQAAYLMGVALESARPAFAGTLRVLGVGEDLAVMDTVQLDLSNRPEYMGRTFQIVNRIDNWDGTFDLTLQETRANVWSLDPDTFLPTDPTPVTDTSYLWNVAPVTGLVIDAQKPQALADGAAVVRVDMVWDEHPQPYVRQGGRIELRYRAPNGDWAWITPVAGDATGTSFTAALIDGVTYQFQARAVNGVGAVSNWTDGWEDYDGVIGAPPAITSLTTFGVVKGIDLSWVMPGTRNAIRHTEIRYGASNQFQDAVLLGHFAWPTDRHSLLGLAYTAQLWFWARLVDENGTGGPWFPSESAPGVMGRPEQDPADLLDWLGDQIVTTPEFESLARGVREIAVEIYRFDSDLGAQDDLLKRLVSVDKVLDRNIRAQHVYFEEITDDLIQTTEALVLWGDGVDNAIIDMRTVQDGLVDVTQQLSVRVTDAEADATAALAQITEESGVRAAADKQLAFRNLLMEVEQGANESFMRDTTRVQRELVRRTEQIATQTAQTGALVQGLQEVIANDQEATARDVSTLYAGMNRSDRRANGLAFLEGVLNDADSKAIIQRARMTTASEVGAMAQDIYTMSVSVDEISAAMQITLETVASLDGGVRSHYQISLQANAFGQQVMTGIAMGAAIGADGVRQSELILMADRTSFVASLDGQRHFPLVIDALNDTVFMRGAFIDELHGNKIITDTLDADRITSASFYTKLANIEQAYVDYMNLIEGSVRTLHVADANITRLKIGQGAATAWHLFERAIGDVTIPHAWWTAMLDTWFSIAEPVVALDLEFILLVESTQFEWPVPDVVFRITVGGMVIGDQFTATEFAWPQHTSFNGLLYRLTWPIRCELGPGAHNIKVEAYRSAPSGGEAWFRHGISARVGVNYR